MKTWEMMQPSGKKFRRKSDGFVIEIASDGTLYWDSGHRFLNINDEWEEVKEPVDFMEVVKSGKKFKLINEDDTEGILTRYMDLNKFMRTLSNLHSKELSVAVLTEGEFYIED